MDRKSWKKEGKLHPIPKEPVPLDTLHVDHVGPLTETNKSYNHILAVVDGFTKFIWLFPTKTTTANETIQKMKSITNTFGNPRRIIADRGKAFTSNLFQDFCKDNNIQLIFCTTGMPRANGQIERMHRIVLNSFAKISIDDPSKWYKNVKSVQRFLNSTHQRSINTTPFELLIGTPMRNELGEIAKIIEEEIRNEFTMQRDELRMKSKEAIDRIQRENQTSFNKKRKESRVYNEDDVVAIAKTQFETRSKLKPKNIGPYKVTKVKTNERYDVERIGQTDGPKKTSTGSENMKPWSSIFMMKKVPQQTLKTIVIEGGIAAGKTTLVEWLSRNPDVQIFPEPLSQWHSLNGFNILEAFYENPTKWIFPFQSYVILTMAERHLQQTTKPIKIMERSLMGADKCFIELALQRQTIEKPEYDILEDWIRFIKNNHNLDISELIYIRVPPSIAYQRIQNRQRTGEQHITIEYLTLLDTLYEDWLLNEQEILVHIIDGTQTIESVRNEVTSILNQSLMK